MTNHADPRIGTIRLGRLAALALLASPLACTNGDSLTNPPSNDGRGNVPWSVNLNYRAINIAVGQQVQLAVNPIDAEGAPMSGLPPLVYTVSDTSVKVDASGKLTAKAEHQNILLVARIQSVEGNWTKADSARITVVDAPYPIAGIRMVPDGPELQPANQWRSFYAFAVDAAGNALLDAAGDTIRPKTHYVASTPRNQYYLWNSWEGEGLGQNLSEPKITGTTYAFGNTYRDSVKFKVTYPDTGRLLIARVSYNLTKSPSAMSQTDLTILQGGTVLFLSLNTTKQDDIVFDDLANVVGGNIPVVRTSWPGDAVNFPKLGKFTYHSASGFKGTITVVQRP
jgi:hypothetical protein